MEDRNILELEAKLANVAGKSVLEIGAGDGRLTAMLLRHNPKKVFAVEKDQKFASILKEKFASSPVDIIEDDFLKIKIPDVDIIIGNIPYYISSDIIFSLKDLDFEHAILMVQKEFAQKMIAKPKESRYGRLSVTSQIYFHVQLERIVPRHLFRPMPKVDSAIIILKPKKIQLTQLQENIIRYLFQHKNKSVRNALLDSKVYSEEELTILGPVLKKKVRTLSGTDCLDISKILVNV